MSPAPLPLDGGSRQRCCCKPALSLTLAPFRVIISQPLLHPGGPHDWFSKQEHVLSHPGQGGEESCLLYFFPFCLLDAENPTVIKEWGAIDTKSMDP